MAIYKADSRQRIKRSILTGVTPTVPATSDFTDGTWLNTDVRAGEFFYNVADERLWIGTNTTPLELTSIFYYDGDNIVALDNPDSGIALTSLIINGTTNFNSGEASFVAGDTNYNTGDKSILGGQSNTNNGSQSLLIGDTILNNSSNNILCGRNVKADSDNSLTFGRGNVNSFSGGLVGGSTGAYGCFGVVSMTAKTTNATITESFLDTTGTKRFVLPSDTSFYVELSALAVDISTGDCKQFKGEGIIKNVAGTTSLVAAITMASTIADGSMAAATMTITADNANSNLLVQSTGIAATDINWVTTIRYTKVKHV